MTGASKAAKQAALNEMMSWLDALKISDLEEAHKVSASDAQAAYLVLYRFAEELQDELEGDK